MRKKRRFTRRKMLLWIPENGITILKNGSRTFSEMLQAIEQARETVHLETYIFRSDPVGWRFAEALAKKAKEGVAVKFIYDSLGCITTPSDIFFLMREAGVELFEYHPVTTWRGARRLKLRDHRKLLVVDGRIGFAGGINIGREYADLLDEGGGWRDTHVKLEGPAVKRLQQIFLATWIQNRKADIKEHPSYYPTLQPCGSLQVAIAISKGILGRNQIRHAYLDAMQQAQERILITNAYFVPAPRLLRAIKDARQRGIEVSLLLPKRSDVLLVDFASRAFYPKLLRWGVKIFEWEGSVLHAKTAVIDGRWSTIGSYNMDFFSFFYIRDLNVVVDGETFGKEMEAMFEEDLKNSRQVKPEEGIRRNPIRRIVENTLYYLLAWI